jgi:hypothetical protein
MAAASITLPQGKSAVNTKSPGFGENKLKWEKVIQQYDNACTEASRESKSPKAIDNHSSRQLLGKTVCSFRLEPRLKI